MTTELLEPEPDTLVGDVPLERVEVCQGCVFYDKCSETMGECHRFPPSIRNNSQKFSRPLGDLWPPVNSDDWCGEWRAREDPRDADTQH